MFLQLKNVSVVEEGKNVVLNSVECLQVVQAVHILREKIESHSSKIGDGCSCDRGVGPADKERLDGRFARCRRSVSSLRCATTSVATCLRASVWGLVLARFGVNCSLSGWTRRLSRNHL